MKIIPTLQGGIKLVLETALDWVLVKSIVLDATRQGVHLARQLGSFAAHHAVASDWSELIVPELEESFQDDLHHVSAAIEEAAASGAGALWIRPEEAMRWYSSLNQARLVLEELYRFGPAPDYEAPQLSTEEREALLRSGFYCALQDSLLRHALR